MLDLRRRRRGVAIHRHLDYRLATPVEKPDPGARDDRVDRGDLKNRAPLPASGRAGPHRPTVSTVPLPALFPAAEAAGASSASWFAAHGPALIAGVLGAAAASFLCVVAERVPRRQSLAGRSHCVCGRQLRAVENVPVLGWLAARGRAPCCGVRIPVFYVAAEAGLAVVFAAGVAAFGLGPAALVVSAAGCAGVIAVGQRRAARGS
jgi:hypothetical protein